ncbi:hypothetical protein DV26_02020 [Amycolatopsis mediterranei]|uniref:Uncharacterized protein n=1 Tax=Amycolatopsis mediterranei (strain S699) TaxID=713604 RepID=A0A9R0P0X0_AMYMS|nr:hypothetical protein RAM_28615 [Amycolatopsis mediterranei S699]KDO12454.1 hypothetical protein DV26_02020 [Amycolatopsis mediterranei]
MPASVVDRTRYTREPAGGAVNDTGCTTREPSGTERVAPPDAITAPVGLSSRALQAKSTAVPVRSSLETVTERVTVASAG